MRQFQGVKVRVERMAQDDSMSVKKFKKSFLNVGEGCGDGSKLGFGDSRVATTSISNRNI